MEKQFPECRENPLSTTFLTEQEAARLTEMLTIAIEDLEHVSGGLTKAVSACSCCCCHHVSLA